MSCDLSLHNLRAANEKLKSEIYERRSAENALRSSEQRYRHLFNSVPAGLFQMLQDGRIVEANETFLKIFGISELSEVKQIKRKRQS